ncbi:MAG: zinc ribbon domain-containing protein [Candidatus Heimdallarchaeota archaeon]|nr:zinc ribbon domain-containing protein [Candidatus Heimdallarchaeota archaeon]
MISDSTRKHITNSALSFVLAKMLLSFLGFFMSVPTIVVYIFGMLTILAISWLGYGLFVFQSEEKNQNLLYVSLLILGGAALEFIMVILTILVGYNILSFGNSGDLILGIASISPNIAYLIGFYLLREIVNSFVKTRRNVFRGQMSLPIGYGVLIASQITLIVKPIEYIVEEGELVPADPAYYTVISFMTIAVLVMLVLGYWNLRRTFLVLDRVPKQLLEKIKPLTYTQAQNPYDSRYQQVNQLTQPGAGAIPPEPIEEKIQQPVEGKKMFCIQCGLELDPDARFCPHCGSDNPYLT